MADDQGFERLAEGLGNALAELIQRGFEPPFFVAIVAVNGSASFFKYELDGDEFSAECLAEHAEPPGFKTPINLMYVDSRGEAAHVVIKGPGATPEILLN